MPFVSSLRSVFPTAMEVMAILGPEATGHADPGPQPRESRHAVRGLVANARPGSTTLAKLHRQHHSAADRHRAVKRLRRISINPRELSQNKVVMRI